MLTSRRPALLKRIFWSPPFVPDASTGLICSICNKVVDLEDAKTDESGDAVHEECYVLKLTQVADKENWTDAKSALLGIALKFRLQVFFSQ